MMPPELTKLPLAIACNNSIFGDRKNAAFKKMLPRVTDKNIDNQS